MRNWLRMGVGRAGLDRMGLAKAGRGLGWVVLLGLGMAAIGTVRQAVRWLDGAEAVHAQAVTTTNEVRAMRGLGPIEEKQPPAPSL